MSKHNTQIVLGKNADGRDVAADLDVLIKTRLLIQANSGGGKSWLLRRLAEQLFGKVPVIIIDPEGEFATLREKFGYVLAGKGGETPADPRSAALLAIKLLELRASAVCDLYELKKPDRHRWVKLFLEALIDAPKTLWRPTVVVIDEAHVFCPEGKAGESEASGAVVDMATRGRKRRFCCVLATQRLGKLRKDATAELLNRLIGPTFEDIDLDRVSEVLSVASADKKEFFAQMRIADPGQFYALGRAICVERTLLSVGPVQTSHEIEDSKFGAVPPLPETLKGILPKLADLPKEAEDKARTEAELRKEITDLKWQLAASASARPPAEPVEVPVLNALQEKLLTDLEGRWMGVHQTLTGIAQDQELLLEEFKGVRRGRFEKVPILNDAGKVVAVATYDRGAVKRSPAGGRLPKPLNSGRHASANLNQNDSNSDGADTLTGTRQKILDTIFMLRVRGLVPNRGMIARWLGIHPNGGRYGSDLVWLRARGCIDGCELTDHGRALAHGSDTGPTAAREVLEGTEQNIFDQLSGGASFDRDSLAAALGIHPNGGRYGSNLARLRTMGLIPERGEIKLTVAAFS